MPSLSLPPHLITLAKSSYPDHAITLKKKKKVKAASYKLNSNIKFNSGKPDNLYPFQESQSTQLVPMTAAGNYQVQLERIHAAPARYAKLSQYLRKERHSL